MFKNTKTVWHRGRMIKGITYIQKRNSFNQSEDAQGYIKFKKSHDCTLQ